MDILPVNNAYGAQVVNDLSGVQPPAQTQDETDGMGWSGGGMGASQIMAQARAMERASGLGNRVDLYV